MTSSTYPISQAAALLPIIVVMLLQHSTVVSAFRDGIISIDHTNFKAIVEDPLHLILPFSAEDNEQLRSARHIDHAIQCRTDKEGAGHWSMVPTQPQRTSNSFTLRVHHVDVPHTLVKFDVRDPGGQLATEWVEFARKGVEATCANCNPSTHMSSKKASEVLQAINRQSTQQPYKREAALLHHIMKGRSSDCRAQSTVQQMRQSMENQYVNRVELAGADGIALPSLSGKLDQLCAKTSTPNTTVNIVLLRHTVLPAEVNCHHEWWWNDREFFNMELCNDTRFQVEFPTTEPFRPQFVLFKRSVELTYNPGSNLFGASLHSTGAVRFDSTPFDGKLVESGSQRSSEGRLTTKKKHPLWRQRINRANLERFVQRQITSEITVTTDVHHHVSTTLTASITPWSPTPMSVLASYTSISRGDRVELVAQTHNHFKLMKLCQQLFMESSSFLQRLHDAKEATNKASRRSSVSRIGNIVLQYLSKILAKMVPMAEEATNKDIQETMRSALSVLLHEHQRLEKLLVMDERAGGPRGKSSTQKESSEIQLYVVSLFKTPTEVLMELGMYERG